MSEDPLDRIPWPLRTRRLTIRRATARDAAAVHAYHRKDGVLEWMMYPCSPWERYREEFAEPSGLAQRLVVETDGRVVGDLKLAVLDAWAQEQVRSQAAGTEAEVGWILDPAVQGQGLATEAMRAVIGAVFEHTRVRRVVAYAFADNVASLALMSTLGMRREALNRRDSLHRTRGWIDGVTYAVLEDEWADVPR
ncbi:GNAT family N-acetyltransferase [Nocardioides rotundus]|uniref:GNAT family N-acetyltransferase n=1 Tax=Nocardioides rotundus TaxID=1774216 RepID=UPI001CBBA24C|nr:GNAT family protein [Nocardioides rotundus]UAL31337.1 GNAT family N-acetyltransferase [Nocardioides rotundus]